MMGHLEAEDLLRGLIDRPLTSVEFFSNYLALIFDDMRITAYVWPTLVEDDISYDFGDQRYEKELRTLIEFIVHKVSLSTSGSRIKMAVGLADIYFPLPPNKYKGPIFALNNGEYNIVWRKGDYPF
jgi:hypothetical protein